jgi:hypothetical protein
VLKLLEIYLYDCLIMNTEINLRDYFCISHYFILFFYFLFLLHIMRYASQAFGLHSVYERSDTSHLCIYVNLHLSCRPTLIS